MKQAFSWYIKPTDEEIKKIWEEGTLTVDTNVLLDLYRYHEATRNSLLNSLSNFKKIWLSHQVTEEFFRNRTKVIVSSKSIFDEATETVKKINTEFENAVAQLKGNRIIPSTVAEDLIGKISPIINDAKKKYC